MNRVQFAERQGFALWPKFTQILESIDSGEKKIAIRSCNGAGKSTLLSILFGYEFDRIVREQLDTSLTIIATGGTATQLRNSLWAACKRSVRHLRPKIEIKDTKIQLSESQIAIRINPASIEGGQGFHADRVVILLDEATAFSKEMLTALLSNATGDNTLCVLTFNPIDTDSAVFDLEETDPSWKRFEISAFEHPNVIEGLEIIPGAVTRSFVDAQLMGNSMETIATLPNAIHTKWNNKYWHPTAQAMARVCGEWSVAVSHGFIPMQEILQCCKEREVVSAGLVSIGVDIAARGDDKTVLTVFYGNEQKEYRSIQIGEFQYIAAFIHQAVRDHNATIICIDDTGIGNAVTDRLQGISDLNALIIPVNFSSKPKGFEKLRKPYNARAEMYMCLEKEIRSETIKLIYKADAIKEIGAARIVTMKGREEVRLEDKELIKRRIGRSPDHADAVALARYGTRLFKFFNQPRLL